MDSRSPYRHGICIALAAAFSVTVLWVIAATVDGVPTDISHALPSQSEHHPEWLIATMSPAHGFQRRMIIRQTWQQLFADAAHWDTRFVISRAASPIWQAMIDAENQTYGDIIQLNHLEESGKVANTVKTIEFLKYLAGVTDRLETKSGASAGRPLGTWQFVSKIDDDSYLDAKAFWHDYLLPLRDRNRTLVARTVYQDNFTAPGGQFYTLTADLVALLVQLHTENPLTDVPEDVLIGQLLHEADESYTHIDLPNEIAFDYDDTQLLEQGKAFASPEADLSGWKHAVGPASVNPHKMRDDHTYVKVAECFDEHGVIKISG